MNIYKTSFLSLIATIVKTLSLFIVNKFVAVVGGPVALTQLGNFQNFSAIIQMFAGTMYQTATTKFTSELSSDESRKVFIKNLLTLALIQCAFVILVLIFYVDEISFKVFNDANNDIVLLLFLLCLPFIVFCIILNSFFNGIQYIRWFIGVNIVSAITNLFLVLIFGYLWGEVGIYSAFAVYYFLVFFFVLKKIIIYIGCRSFLTPFYLDFTLLKKVLFFSLITISSILISNITLIVIRYIISSSTLPNNYVGYWQGVWNLSQVAMSFITISLSTYLLPAISKSETYFQVKKELLVSARLIIPFSFVLSISIYILREYLVIFLFTKEFMPMTDMFFWQFSGNVVKSISWLFGFVFVSRGMVKITVFTEVLVAIFFIFTCNFFVDNGVLEAPVFAYFLTAVFHLVLMVSLFFRVMKNEFQ
ncbi:oligosaccharide flippase family protein [Marinomonas sp. BSi20584]|uniref:oligosaccharide flippase family protein n=1 Tax=Marinomonas sp. BSi20584 TaxID=1594462 RepID=UPI000C1DFCC1|nr:oligosaccharide flippase family protein [Marinomonas sp. BSi20584]PJE53314.1 hypothetical protein TY87_21415 [Marinomonas sp. BSi20584]